MKVEARQEGDKIGAWPNEAMLYGITGQCGVRSRGHYEPLSGWMGGGFLAEFGEVVFELPTPPRRSLPPRAPHDNTSRLDNVKSNLH